MHEREDLNEVLARVYRAMRTALSAASCCRSNFGWWMKLRGLVAEIEFRMQVALTRSIQVASTRSNAGRPSA
ncbi:hypothetical protein, partial [Pseudovibrio axinellae]|uniref:hypothetical protein n=1 Tax=Pseudovibrio axinellae TaxID=989403 RepID=UPI001AD8B827